MAMTVAIYFPLYGSSVQTPHSLTCVSTKMDRVSVMVAIYFPLYGSSVQTSHSLTCVSTRMDSVSDGGNLFSSVWFKCSDIPLSHLCFYKDGHQVNDGGDVDGVDVSVFLCVVQQSFRHPQHMRLVQRPVGQLLKLYQ